VSIIGIMPAEHAHAKRFRRRLSQSDRAEKINGDRPMKHHRAWGAYALLYAASFGLVPAAQAQNAWPAKPVRVIVPYAAGGSADTLGRVITRHLSDVFKQPFVIENRGGAGGLIGSQMVARADPDGYTLVVSGVGSHVVAPIQAPEKPFDPINDFTHIALLGGPPTVLVVNPSLPVKDEKGFVAYVKTQPKGVSWGSPGQYASLIGEAYRKATALDLVQILYKGANPAVADVVGNQVPSAFVTLTTAAGNLRSGRLRPLAVSSTQRIADFPDVPTFKELGYPQLTGITWFSLSGPAHMPPALVARLNAEVRQALQSPEGKAELVKQNMETFDWDSATFTKYVKYEI